jgi:cytochrome c-type biogenesis protein
MLEELLTYLSTALTQSFFFALLSAFLWGVISILLSPCHLASVPLLVGFLTMQAKSGSKRAFQLSLLFSVGVLMSIALLGVITASAGRILGDLGRTGNAVVALIFLVFGFYLMDLLKLQWNQPGIAARFRGGPGALIIGLIFGVALGPCTFAFMAPVLGVVFSKAGSNPGNALSLLGAFALGHCGVIVLAGTLTHSVERYLGWSENHQTLKWLRRFCGVLVFWAGIYMLRRSLSAF